MSFPQPQPQQPNFRPGLRLAIALILRCRFDLGMVVVAVVCSSWSIVNVATSQRDVLTPYGDTSLGSVRSGNKMVSRTILGQLVES